MTLLFVNDEDLPKVPAEIQAYLDDLNAQGFRFDKIYVPDDDKDLEIEVYNSLQAAGMTTVVCNTAQAAGRITHWVKSLPED